MARHIAPIGHEEQLTLVDHLGELRTRLFASFIFVAFVFVFTFWQSDRVLGILTKPVDDALSNVSSEEEKKNDADEVQRAYQVAVSKALMVLQKDSADLAEAVGALKASDSVARDSALRAKIAGLEDRIEDRAATLNALDLTAPEIDRRPITLGVTEPFLVTITSSLYAALLLSLPFLLYQAYAFLIPAFTPRERKVALPLMVMVPFLFLGGVAFAYYLVLPQATNFLLNFNDGEFDIQVQGREAVKFTTSFLIAIGLMFQLPVGILAVNRSGIVSVAQLRQFRRYALVIGVALAAVLTPTPDPGTMLIAWAPLIVLYELSILVASWLDRFRPVEPAPEQFDLDDLSEYAPLPLDDDD